MAEALLPGRIALLGNPNCGKTALFNLLTGSRQKVANYAGVTVERKEGLLRTRRADACSCSTCPAPTASMRSARTKPSPATSSPARVMKRCPICSSA